MRDKKITLDNSTKNKEIKASENKKWIIGILAGIIVLLVAALITSITIDNSIVISYLSNASHLVSIVLAIVAIVYAFNQSNQSANQYSMMVQILNNISSEISRLQMIKEETREAVKELTNNLDKVVQEAKERLPKDGSNDTIKSLDEISEKINTIKSSTAIENEMPYIISGSELPSEIIKNMQAALGLNKTYEQYKKYNKD